MHEYDPYNFKTKSPSELRDMSTEDLFEYTYQRLLADSLNSFAVMATMSREDLKGELLRATLLALAKVEPSEGYAHLGPMGHIHEVTWGFEVSGEFDRVMEKDD